MKRKTASLSDQVKKRVSTPVKKKPEYEGNTETMISTGSTLLDLAISGGRVRGGGIPGGIMVEVFGPSGSGKTVLLCEIAGAVQRLGGDIMFHDPEARLNKQFASMFDLDTRKIDYSTPDTIPLVFNSIQNWEPKGKILNGIFTDSLAALSTELEMDNEDGDKMGMRRAKEFSEGLRKTARILAQTDRIMVCSNQVRTNVDAGKFGVKYDAPGGKAIGFYSSLRLRFSNPTKINRTIKVAGKEVKRAIGVTTTVEVFKSSIWKPYRTAPLTILFDYGIDNTRENLQFIKTYTKATRYVLDDSVLGRSLEEAIQVVEEAELENEIQELTINLWEEIESKFDTNRKKKER
jgi:recombination protein RecA